MSKAKRRLVCEDQQQTTEQCGPSKVNVAMVVFISVAIGYCYMQHVEQLFENDKHFSHLSTLERELSFRTESGLYYYYFKLLVSRQVTQRTPPKANIPANAQIVYKYEYNSQDLLSNIHENILNDNRTEHPTTINALQRFNLYPEVAVSVVYHLFYKLNLLTQKCWTVNRGADLPPVQSCIGYAEPIYFYAKAVFIMHGLAFVFLFLLCWLLNDYSIEAGLLGCLCYVYNHGEATRVMWSPALRESFAYPFHVLQLVLVTRELKTSGSTSRTMSVLFVLTTLFYLLTWQFAQFSLGTQAAALYFTFILGYITRSKLVKLLAMHTASLALCFLFMFANRMLLASFQSSILLSIWLLVAADHIFKAFLKVKFLRLVIQVTAFFILIISVKKYILPLVCFIDDDDTHIWDILKSKLSVFVGKEFYTFDTRLYTCAKEFDFLEFETLVKLSKSVLLPVVVLNVVYAVGRLLLSKTSAVEAHVVYNMLQLAAFTLMAGLIMRLKLFWTPHLCVVFTLIVHERFSLLNLLLKVNYKGMMKYTIVGLLIALMSVEGVANLKRQYDILGEYNDYPMENLVNWINLNTKEYNSFAGSMPAMANVKLSTNRAIMNHPHYENNDLRLRTRLLYSSVYGFKNVSTLHDLLKNKYKVDYLVLESYYCLSHPPDKPECAMSTIAHINDAEQQRTANRVCQELINDSAKKQFKKVFQIQHISVHKVL